MNIYKGLFLALALLITGIQCSSTSSVSTETTSKAAPSIYPVWYNNSGYLADSLSFHGFGTAVSSDSLSAITKAENQARIILEAEIAEITEIIREDLVEGGSNAAKNTDFIIILRTAHSLVQQEADKGQGIARNTNGRYRGFASVSITKEKIVSTLEKGFNGHPRYWSEFSGVQSFSSNFK